MTARTADENPPAILVLVEVIRAYREVSDPAGLGELLFTVEKAIAGEDYAEPKTGGERSTFRRLLTAAEKGIEAYEKMSRRGAAGAVARWGGGHAGSGARQTTAKPSEPKAIIPAPVPAKPAPVPARSVPANPSGGERRGGVKTLADSMGNLAAMFGDGGDIADMINADPVKAALKITGETGSARAENTFKKLLRTKGAEAFCDELFAFNSECKNGEEPKNRGAALVARIGNLPDTSGGKA